MCSSGSQAQDLGGGWKESFLGMYCILSTMIVDRVLLT